MKVLKAEPLMASIGSGGRFSVERAVWTSPKQAAQALAAANEAGFIHGHLTPESILVANTPDTANVKVFDFEPAATANQRTADEKPAANVAYLAPEQFSGLRNIDGRTDIYSLGIILYQMLTGEVPFKGETPTDVILKHAEEAPPLLRSLRPDAPQSLDAVVQKALAKDPDERYQTAAEFAADLENISNENVPCVDKHHLENGCDRPYRHRCSCCGVDLFDLSKTKRPPDAAAGRCERTASSANKSGNRCG